MQCSKSPAGAAAVRLAVLLDMLYFTPGADSLSSIEPACLVIVRAHPSCVGLVDGASCYKAAAQARGPSGELCQRHRGACQAGLLGTWVQTVPQMNASMTKQLL